MYSRVAIGVVMDAGAMCAEANQRRLYIVREKCLYMCAVCALSSARSVLIAYVYVSAGATTINYVWVCVRCGHVQIFASCVCLALFSV